jgi:uncharacterized protein (DUF885 family)
MSAYPNVAADFMRSTGYSGLRASSTTPASMPGLDRSAGDRLHDQHRQAVADEARAEVQRDITLHWLSTGYKIGMLKIMELRQKAQGALGSKFDVKAFDDLIISNGSQPLPVLERRVDEWIASRS